MNETAARAATLPYATQPPDVRPLRRLAAWAVLVAAFCAVLSVFKALAYGLLAFQARQVGTQAGATSPAWALWLVGGVAVELVAGAIAVIWLFSALGLRRRLGLTPTAADRLRYTGLIIVVQLALLGYALLAGTHGVQLWGSGVCLVASGLLAWRAGAAFSEPRAPASG